LVTTLVLIAIAAILTGSIALAWSLALKRSDHELLVVGEILSRVLVFIRNARLVHHPTNSSMNLVTAHRKHAYREKALEIEWNIPKGYIRHSKDECLETASISIAGTLLDPYGMGSDMDGVRYKSLTFRIWCAENPYATKDAETSGLCYMLSLIDKRGKQLIAGSEECPRSIDASAIEREGFDFAIEDIIGELEKHKTNGAAVPAAENPA
jgi:hypothetical protein